MERLQERLDAAEFARLMEFLEVCPPVEERLDWLVAAGVHRICSWIAAGAGGKYEARTGRLFEWEKSPRQVRREMELAEQQRFAAGMESVAAGGEPGGERDAG